MGGRGGKARARVDQHAPRIPQPQEEDLYLPPDPASRLPDDIDTTPEDTETATEQVAASEAWTRVKAAGLAGASKADLLAARDAVDRVSQRWDIDEELRARAENQVRQASRVAAETDRSMPDARATQVRDAINDIGARIREGDWMSMSDLRAALPSDMTRAEIDATLKRLSRANDITLAPDPDRKNVHLSDHENAILIGGDFNNLIAWNRPPARDVTTPHAVTQAVRTTYAEMQRSGDPHGLLRLADLRARLETRYSRAEVDAALKEMSRNRQIDLAPGSNTKALTQADRDAAIRIGTQEQHLISIHDPNPRTDPD